MKFRYYIVSTFNGEVTGTDDAELALSHVGCEDDYVIDSETGKWLIDVNDQATGVDIEVAK